MRMSRALSVLLLSVFSLTGFSGCAVNPATGRTELALIPVSTSQEIAIDGKLGRAAAGRARALEGR